MPHAGAPGAGRSNRADLVAHADDAVAHDVGPQAARAVERGTHSGPGQLLEVRAGRAVAHANHHDLADAELPADERVEVDAFGDDVAARLVLADRHAARVGRSDRLACDQRDLSAAALACGELAGLRGVAITCES